SLKKSSSGSSKGDVGLVTVKNVSEEGMVFPISSEMTRVTNEIFTKLQRNKI
ncbi:19465_t:CDS:2, partial [Entrophospora sp. SA101]